MNLKGNYSLEFNENLEALQKICEKRVPANQFYEFIKVAENWQIGDLSGLFEFSNFEDLTNAVFYNFKFYKNNKLNRKLYGDKYINDYNEIVKENYENN